MFSRNGGSKRDIQAYTVFWCENFLEMISSKRENEG
jgi:hypothetical protein